MNDFAHDSNFLLFGVQSILNDSGSAQKSELRWEGGVGFLGGEVWGLRTWP